MKKTVLLLSILSLFGFTASENPGMKLKVTKVTPLSATKYDVGVELHNELDRKVNFLSMYCSDSGFYVTDNVNVVVTPVPCDKNYPTSVPIARNSYRTGSVKLELKYAKYAKFRVGFKFVEIPKGTVVPFDYDTTNVKSTTYWSNEMEFKVK